MAAGPLEGVEQRHSARRNGGIVCDQYGDGDADEITEVGSGLMVLSVSVDGAVRIWETLGKSEQYRMQHPSGVEVTSILVLPGGFILATGEDGAPAPLLHEHSAREFRS